MPPTLDDIVQKILAADLEGALQDLVEAARYRRSGEPQRLTAGTLLAGWRNVMAQRNKGWLTIEVGLTAFNQYVDKAQVLVGELRLLAETLEPQPVPTPPTTNSAAPCPYSATTVGSSIFIDRASLRATLRQMVTMPQGPRLLVLTGPSCSGKTHSYLLLQSGCTHYGYEALFTDVAALSLEGGVPEAVVKSVVSRMGIDAAGLELRAGDPATARTTGELADLAVGRIRNASAGRKWWLVFDGLDRQSVPPAMVTAVITLAQKLLTDLTNVFVCLLGYDGPVVAPASAYLRHETLTAIGPPELHQERSQIERHLSFVLTTRDPTIGHDIVQLVADSVLRQLPPSDTLCSLKRLVDEATTRMLASP